MAKPKLLMMGAYAAWDMDDLYANYDVLKYWEAPDRDAFVRSHGADVRAIATGGELGASALAGKRIKGAGLDVFWNEPDIDQRFKALDNVVLRPHHVSGTVETHKAMGKLARDNLEAHFSGVALITPAV